MTRTRRWLWSVAAVLVTCAGIEGSAALLSEPQTELGSVSEAVVSTSTGANATPGRRRAGLGFRDPNVVLHPYLGYVYQPPEHRREPSRIAVSPDGFLDVAPAVRPRDPTRYRVAILGGSVAGQLGTWHAEKLVAALTRHRVEDGRTVELIRLGMPGYHQPQQILQLVYVLAQGGAIDAVVNIDGFNELAVPMVLNQPKGAHPLFPMNWSMVALDVPDPALRRALGALEYLQDERATAKARFEGSAWARSSAARLVHQYFDDQRALAISEYAARVQSFEPDAIPFFVSGKASDHDPAGGLLGSSVEVWRRGALILRDICEARGIRYVHVLQPNQYDVGSKVLSDEERRIAFDTDSPYRPVIEAGYPMLRRAGVDLAGAGVEFIDASKLFFGDHDTIYKDTCCHFGDRGNERLADLIARVLARG